MRAAVRAIGAAACIAVLMTTGAVCADLIAADRVVVAR